MPLTYCWMFIDNTVFADVDPVFKAELIRYRFFRAFTETHFDGLCCDLPRPGSLTHRHKLTDPSRYSQLAGKIRRILILVEFSI